MGYRVTIQPTNDALLICLLCSIAEGCTLKLVLAMRGGPINIRRGNRNTAGQGTVTWQLDTKNKKTFWGVFSMKCPILKSHSVWVFFHLFLLVTMEDPIKDVSNLMDSTKEDGWEKSISNKQVTFVVYRKGDQLSFFRVVDRGDGTLTPLSESVRWESHHYLLSRIGGRLAMVYSVDCTWHTWSICGLISVLVLHLSATEVCFMLLSAMPCIEVVSNQINELQQERNDWLSWCYAMLCHVYLMSTS